MDIFNALSDSTRRKIIEILAEKGELPATKIHEYFKASAPAISQHLKVLSNSGLVKVEKKAQQRIYSLIPNKIKEIESWSQNLYNLWNDRFKRLDKVLEIEKKKIQESKKDNKNE